VDIHAQVAAADSGPSIFIVFNPDIPEGAQTLPFNVYESALEGEASGASGRFVQLECGVETGEAERIAVDGITKEVGGDGDETGRELLITSEADSQKSRPSRCSVMLLPCCTIVLSCLSNTFRPFSMVSFSSLDGN
jgi:COP9 signalosome complex subunit 6